MTYSSVQTPIRSEQANVVPFHQLNYDTESFVKVSKVFTILKRQKLVAGSVALVILVAAGAWISTVKPYYEVTAQVMIGVRQIMPSAEQAGAIEPAIDVVAINSQVAILRSPTIAANVVSRLHLTGTEEYQRAMEPGGISRLLISLGLIKKPKPLTPDQRERLAAQVLLGNVRVVNDGRSTVISLISRAASPELATDVAKAYVAAYLGFERQAKIDAARHASELLEEQISPLRKRAMAAEAAVSEYREQHDLTAVLPDGDGEEGGRIPSLSLPATPRDARLTQMNRELGEAEADLMRRQAIYDQASSAARHGDVGAVSAVTGSGLIQNLLLEQSNINARISTLAASALDNNPELQAQRSAAARVASQISQESSKILNGLALDLDAARGRVAAIKSEASLLQTDVSTENRASIRLRQLLSEASAARAVYRDYLSRLSEISAETTLQQAEIRVISDAVLPLGPAGPPRKQYGILAFVLAIGAGFAVALLRDRGRQTFRTLAELEAGTRLFGIGIMPNFRGSVRQQFGSHDNVYGQMLNAIRSIISFGQLSLRARVAVVTSARPGEGKTTLAISLAGSVGMSGERALIVDCDPYNPSVLRMLGVSGGSRRGLFSDVLPGVDVFIPPTLATRPDSLDIGAISTLLADCRDDYAQIFLDTPPVVTFPECGIVSSLADGVILAVKWQKTETAAILEARRMLDAYGAHCIGAVLTCVRLEALTESEGNRTGVYARYRSISADKA